MLLWESEPVWHGLAVEIHVERLVPVSVLQGSDGVAVDVLLDFLLIPFQRIHVVVVRKIVRRFPSLAMGKVLRDSAFVLRSMEHVCVHVVCAFMVGGSTTDLEDIDLGPHLRFVLVEPECA